MHLAAHVRGDLTIDQHLALRTTATRWQNEFADTFGEETLGFFTHPRVTIPPERPPDEPHPQRAVRLCAQRRPLPDGRRIPHRASKH